MLTFANRFLSTPVAIVQTLPPCISNQLETFVTPVVCSISRLITSHFHTAVWYILECWTSNSCIMQVSNTLNAKKKKCVETQSHTLADWMRMAPIRPFVILANCVRRSIKFVAIIAVEIDFAADWVLGPSIWSIASVVQAMWWVTGWVVVRGKSYLQSSNCNQENTCKRSCHLKIYTVYSYRWLDTCIEKSLESGFI